MLVTGFVCRSFQYRIRIDSCRQSKAGAKGHAASRGTTQRQLPKCSSRNSLKLNRIEGTSYLIQVPGQVMCRSFDRSPLWRTPPFATGQARIKMGAMGAMKLCLRRTLFAGMTPWIGKEQDVTWREEEGGEDSSRWCPGPGPCRVVSCPVVLAIEVMWAWSLPWMSVVVRVSSLSCTHFHRDPFW